MFSHVDLKYDYSLSSISGAEVSQKLVTDYDESIKVTNYYIEKSSNLLEYLSVYETGLVLYLKQTKSEIKVKSNKPFIADDDGNLHLVDEENK